MECAVICIILVSYFFRATIEYPHNDHFKGQIRFLQSNFSNKESSLLCSKKSTSTLGYYRYSSVQSLTFARI